VPFQRREVSVWGEVYLCFLFHHIDHVLAFHTYEVVVLEDDFEFVEHASYAMRISLSKLAVENVLDLIDDGRILALQALVILLLHLLLHLSPFLPPSALPHHLLVHFLHLGKAVHQFLVLPGVGGDVGDGGLAFE
jgi:hypothetical protein